jgi:hypothetical protein
VFYHQILEDNFLRRPLSLKLNNSWSWGFHQKNLPKPIVQKCALGVQALEINRPGGLPSGKRLHNYGKSPFFMGKSTISMAIFKSYVSLPEGIAIHSGNPYQPTKGRPKKCCLTI